MSRPAWMPLCRFTHERASGEVSCRRPASHHVRMPAEAGVPEALGPFSDLCKMHALMALQDGAMDWHSLAVDCVMPGTQWDVEHNVCGVIMVTAHPRDGWEGRENDLTPA